MIFDVFIVLFAITLIFIVYADTSKRHEVSLLPSLVLLLLGVFVYLDGIQFHTDTQTTISTNTTYVENTTDNTTIGSSSLSSSELETAIYTEPPDLPANLRVRELLGFFFIFVSMSLITSNILYLFKK